MRRRRRRERETGSDPRQKALDLIELALDRNTTEEERRSAAVRAIEFIDRHNLLARPFEGHETVQTVMDVVDRLTEPGLVDGLKKIGERIGQARRRR